MNKLNLTALAAACSLALSASAFGALSKPEYKSSKDEISAKYKSDKAACKAMTGNKKDICIEEAKGREKVAKAELEMAYKPTDRNRHDVRIAKADATYKVAKEKCDDATGNAKDVCVKEAKAAHVAAKADTKVAEAKTAERAAGAPMAMKEKTAEVKKDAAADKRDADYAVAKEKCDAMAGDAKSNCIKSAKARYGQS